MDDLQSQINRYSEKYNINQKQNSEKDKPKFTKETMRRLYPKQEEMEKRERDKLNCDDFNSFFTKLLNYYQNKNNYKLIKMN